MFQIVESYIEEKFEQLNAYSAEGFSVQRITNDLQFENVGASQADINYQLFISQLQFNPEFETPGVFTVDVRIDFTFITAGKDYTVYKSKFDNYIYPFAAMLVNDSRGLNYTSEDNSAIVLNDMQSVSVTNSDRFEDNYYKPSIEFTLQGFASYYSNQTLTSENI